MLRKILPNKEHDDTSHDHPSEENELVLIRASLDQTHDSVAQSERVGDVQHSLLNSLQRHALLAQVRQDVGATGQQVVDVAVRVVQLRVVTQRVVNFDRRVVVRAKRRRHQRFPLKSFLLPLVAKNSIGETPKKFPSYLQLDLV